MSRKASRSSNGKFVSGFMMGLGLGIVLFTLAPSILFIIGAMLQPDSPSYQTLMDTLEWWKIDETIYPALKRLYEVAIQFYDKVEDIKELTYFFMFLMLVGAVISVKGAHKYLQCREEEVKSFEEELKTLKKEIGKKRSRRRSSRKSNSKS